MPLFSGTLRSGILREVCETSRSPKGLEVKIEGFGVGSKLRKVETFNRAPYDNEH